MGRQGGGGGEGLGGGRWIHCRQAPRRARPLPVAVWAGGGGRRGVPDRGGRVAGGLGRGPLSLPAAPGRVGYTSVGGGVRGMRCPRGRGAAAPVAPATGRYLPSWPVTRRPDASAGNAAALLCDWIMGSGRQCHSGGGCPRPVVDRVGRGGGGERAGVRAPRLTRTRLWGPTWLTRRREPRGGGPTSCEGLG